MKIYKTELFSVLVRYTIISLLLVGVFLLGKNLKGDNQHGSESTPPSGTYILAPSQKNITLSDLFKNSVNRGQSYRLTFGIRTKKKITEKIGAPYESKASNSRLMKVSLTSPLGNSSEIKEISVGDDGNTNYEEVIFKANDSYQGLIFEKETMNISDYVVISDIRINDISTEARLAGIIIGQTSFSNPILESTPEGKGTYRLNKKSESVGQVFRATSDTISSAEFKFNFIGSGGVGGYFVELREANTVNNELQISNSRLAYFCFSKESAQNEYMIGESTYKLPIVASLNKDSLYYVGITNVSVSFNFLNTLEILESTNQDKNKTGQEGSYSYRSNRLKQINDLYIKLYGSKFVEVNNDKILTGAVIQDTGNSRGLYQYDQNGQPSNFLDSSTETLRNKQVFYDNVQGGISARSIQGNFIEYKFNMIYPIIKANISFEKIIGSFDDFLTAYSFDGDNWQNIDSSEDSGKVEKVINGDANSRVLYLKFSYDPQGTRGNIGLFGFKKLKVESSLIIN